MPVLRFMLLCLSIGVFSAVHAADSAPAHPQTLLRIAGANAEPARLSESALVIIDAQREYVDGRLRLVGIDDSLKEAMAVLRRARKAGTPVIHVVHHGKPGAALFDPDRPLVEIAEGLAPEPGEEVVIKTLPDAFAGTKLEELIERTGRKNLIVIGYMTHMCVSSTVRAALARGYRTTVVASATATRDLLDSTGGVVPAAQVQRASLAALADRFAAVVASAEQLRD